MIIDTDQKSGWKLNGADGVFYGVATDGQTLFAVARQAPYGQSIQGRREQDNMILTYNSKMQIGRLPKPELPLKDAHQCAFFDSRLWVMNTGENTVSIWDGGNWSEWLPFGDTRDMENPDTHHLNSLNATKDHIALIGNKGGTGTVFLYDRENWSAKGEIDIGGGAHTAWYDDGWQVMASLTGEIRSKSGTQRCIGSYLRGYACDGNIRVLGISEINARQDRATSTARLAIYDMDWTFKHVIEIEGVGMVHDIHALNVKDLSRHEHPQFHCEREAFNGLEPVNLR